MLARKRKTAAPPHRYGMTIPQKGALYEFQDVDRSTDPTSYISYLDQSHANERMRLAKEHIISFLKPQKGNALLDIGCGVGHDAQMLASLVGKTGLVVGIDKSTVMINEAKRRFLQVAQPIQFYACDAHNLHFDQNQFDGSLCCSVLTHCEQPVAVVSEALRVLKPGGQFVVLEPDWDTLVVSTGDQDSDEILTCVLRKSVRHSGIAHQLPTLFKHLGFRSVTVEAAPLTISDFAFANRAWKIDASILHAVKTGIVTSADADRILRRLQRYTCHFFGAFMVFAVMGSKARREV